MSEISYNLPHPRREMTMFSVVNLCVLVAGGRNIYLERPSSFLGAVEVRNSHPLAIFSHSGPSKIVSCLLPGTVYYCTLTSAAVCYYCVGRVCRTSAEFYRKIWFVSARYATQSCFRAHIIYQVRHTIPGTSYNTTYVMQYQVESSIV